MEYQNALQNNQINIKVNIWTNLAICIMLSRAKWMFHSQKWMKFCLLSAPVEKKNLIDFTFVGFTLSYSFLLQPRMV